MRNPIRQTMSTSRRVLAHRCYRRSTAAVGAAYLVAFLAAIQDLTASGGAFNLVTVDPALMVRRTGFLLFDAVAVVTTPLFTLLVSPVNIVFGLLLSFLVGLNLTLSYIAWRQPKVCRINGATGTLGIFPALLAGGACCAPTILLVFGIQATAALITTVQWMIPAAFVLLAGSLVLIAAKTAAERL